MVRHFQEGKESFNSVVARLRGRAYVYDVFIPHLPRFYSIIITFVLFPCTLAPLHPCSLPLFLHSPAIISNNILLQSIIRRILSMVFVCALSHSMPT